MLFIIIIVIIYVM